MTLHMKNPTAGGAAGLENASLPGGIDGHSSAPEIAPAQENLLLEAIKALSAEEICADTLENIPLMLAVSGWRSAAALLVHAAQLIEAGDFQSAERNRRQAREQFNATTDAFRQFQEARAADAAWIGAEAFRDIEPIDRGRRAAEVARMSVLPIDSATRP
jgi:hypothetical protein